MTTVELYNLALYKIGVSGGIASLSDQSREAITGSAVYDHILRVTLRHFPWSFATKYLDLTLVGGPVPSDDSLVQSWSATQTYQITDAVDLSGTRYYAIAASVNHTPPNSTYWSTTAPEYVNKDWVYSYRWPTDCLFARRMPSASLIGRQFDPNPIPFRIGRDVNGLLIYANEADANLEYTCLDCDALWADDLWIDCFTWRIAAMIAPSLSQIPNMTQTCYAMFLQTLRTASAVSSNESQMEKDGDASWITDRN